VLRARDYHSKRDRITRLRQKAADRNKDEFYFGMHRQRTEKGVHVQDRGNVALPIDFVKILKSQDENYIRTMRTVGLKKIDKLKGRLSALADLVKPNSFEEDDESEELDEEEIDILREAGIFADTSKTSKRRNSKRKPSQHIVFAEDEQEAQQQLQQNSSRVENRTNQSEPTPTDVDERMELGWKPSEQKKLKKRAGQGTDTEYMDVEEAEERKKLNLENRSRLLKELAARLHRDKQLRYAERELEMQKLLMGKGGSRKMKGIEKVEGDDDEEDDDEDDDKRRQKKVDEKTWKPKVYKWKLERKR